MQTPLELLRPNVLEGVRLTIAAARPLSPPAAAVADRAAALGGSVQRVAVDAGGEEVDVSADVLLWDGHTAPTDIRAALDAPWLAIRPIGTAAAPARILLLAPAPGDATAEAVRAGLENLARTLSIEWARLDIRPVAILPGSATSPAEVAELAAFLSSPAGEYYSGCAFTLGSAR